MKRIVVALLIFSFATSARAGEMRTFLLSCAYGAGFGGLAGLTALAFSEQPGSNLNYLTRGASLGLYVGAGVGYYLASQNQIEVRGDTQPSAQNSPTQTVAQSEDFNPPAMPILAFVPHQNSTDVLVGYRFQIP